MQIVSRSSSVLKNNLGGNGVLRMFSLNSHHKFPEVALCTFLNVLFCLIGSPNLKDIWFTIVGDNENLKIFPFEKMVRLNFAIFALRNHFNDKSIINWLLAYCFSSKFERRSQLCKVKLRRNVYKMMHKTSGICPFVRMVQPYKNVVFGLNILLNVNIIQLQLRAATSCQTECK